MQSNNFNIIYEYENIEDEKLANHIKNTPSLQQYFKTSFKGSGIKAKQYCGIINFDGKNYYILPKISNNKEHNLNIFIYMLIFAYDIKLSNENIANCENHKFTIIEVLVQLFAKNLLNEFTKGVYKTYINIQDNLTLLKGKYLINENLKYNFTKNKIYCEYDEFSPNNTLNQFFLYAIKTLMPYVKDKKLLKKCDLVLEDVDFTHINIHQVNMSFVKLNARFKSSFELAMLLLKKYIPLFSQDKNSFAFLFDMNDLFERFIGRVYEKVDDTARLQNERNFGNLKLKPDIITSTQIIDTKYKIVKNRDDLATSDKYQMFVYGVNFDISDTMLLYPKYNLYNLDEDLKLGKDDKIINLAMRCVDLDFNGGYDEYIESIINQIEMIDDVYIYDNAKANFSEAVSFDKVVKNIRN